LVLESVRLAFSQLFEAQFRAAMWKSLGLTIALLIGGWFALEALVSSMIGPYLGSWPWVATALVWLTGSGFLIGALFLIAPVTAVFAGLFLDDIAAVVEARHYPGDVPGKAMAILPSVLLSLKFLLVVAAANLVALLLVLLPGINFAIFFLVNGYLLGREYFQFAAMRFRSEADASRLRRQNGTPVFLAGMVIAGFMVVPLLNLLTPAFAAATMVHLHKRIALADRSSAAAQAAAG
jgi:CysZ protein